ITALVAATIACAQMDIKKVLAYSTVSQLGYMFLAVGLGAYWVAIFHMVTHAFFKACLFLGSGSVIHGMHDEQDMRRMGNLRKFMPITAITFMIAWLAIAGDAARSRALAQVPDLDLQFDPEPPHSTHVGPGYHPHASHWMMTLPLIVLAVLSVVGGFLSIPFGSLQFIEHWLEPSFEY